MKQIRWKPALGYGLLTWLMPFLISIALFPLRQANAPLFESAMNICLVLAAALASGLYFRRGEMPGIMQSAFIGVLWTAINLAMDYPMFAYGPMKLPAAQYYSQIGIDYLIFPAFLAGSAWSCARWMKA